MTPIRVAGSVLGLITGIWAMYVQHDLLVHGASTPLLVAGALLALASVVSLGGFRFVFVVGAVLSLVTLVLVADIWGDFPKGDELATVLLAIVTALVDIGASRPSKALSEKDSPLNLPVFG